MHTPQNTDQWANFKIKQMSTWSHLVFALGHLLDAELMSTVALGDLLFDLIVNEFAVGRRPLARPRSRATLQETTDTSSVFNR